MRLSFAQIQEIERTVRRIPEVMVRISSAQSNDFDAVAVHIERITCRGEIAMETDSGEMMQGSGIGRRFMEAMDLDLERYRRRSELRVPLGAILPKLVHKIVLSMPSGTSAPGLLAASRNFLRDEFRSEHRYGFLLRLDKPHPYIQVVLKAMSEHGIRLHIRKPVLRRWRVEFARHLCEVGIPANATQRALRGIRQSKPPAIYHLEQRGSSTRLHARAESVRAALNRGRLGTERSKAKLVQTRVDIERRWRAIHGALRRQGVPELAEEVLRFVGEMRPPMTDREQLAADLASGAIFPKQNTPLFSR